MARVLNYVKTVDGVEMLFHRSADGSSFCEPVDVEAFDAYVASLGPEGVQARVAELRAGNDSTAWKAAAQERLDKIQDELRLERLEKQRAEIYG